MSDDKALLTLEETDEFSDTLMALESTVKRHLSKAAESRISGKEQPSGDLQLSKPPRSLSSLRREITTMTSTVKMPNRPDRVIVFMRIVILKVGDIDTLRDKFSADVFIQSKWREPAMDGKFKQKNAPINWELYWNPRLSLDNVIGEPKENIWHSVIFDSAGLATIVEKRRISGAFLEFMELYQFPFDTQDLSVSVKTDRDQSEVELIEDPRERCILNVQSFGDVQEWKLHNSCTTWMDIKEEAFKNNNKKHPTFGASCKVSRRPQFFIWNILVVMTLICSLAFSTFSVSYTIPHSRLQLTFILLLTCVSFKFVANQNLPTISYLTYLDRYILGLMGILILVCIWHAVIYFIFNSLKCDGNTTWLIDTLAFGFFSGLYAIFHIVFLCAVACVEKDSAGHGGNTCNEGGEMNFDEDYAEDGNLDFGTGTGSSAIVNANNADSNQQAVIAACGFD